MPKYNGSIEAAVADNGSRKCKAKGCPKNRYRLSGYCAHHTSRNNLNGHPTAPPFRAYKHFQDYYEVAQQIVQQNNDTHPGIKFGLSTIERYLTAAKLGSTFLSMNLAECLVQGIEKGATAEDMLAVAGGLYAFSNTIQGSELQHNDRFMTTMLGYNMLKVRKSSGFPYGGARRELGKLVQDELGVLLIRLEQSILKRMKLEEDALKYQQMDIPV